MTNARWTIVVALVVMAASDRAAAQGRGPVVRPNRLTVSAGLIASAGYAIGDRNAELRRNSTGTPSPFTLFHAQSALNRATGLEARMALAFTRLLSIEVGGTFTTPQLGVTITQDNEGDPLTVVAEDISQYTVDVGAIIQLPWIRLGARARPYVIGGGGYLRQLHEDRLLVETGSLAYVGGGVRYWLRGGPLTRRGLGVRADTRYVHRARGIDFEDRSRGYAAISVLGFVGF